LSIVGATEDNTKYSDEQLQNLANKSKNEDFKNRVIEWTKSAHQRCRTVR
jgi:hypothetical protein